MQYVGRALDSVSKTWSSINPATLSGAVDVIVVEQENGDLACSPFHVRFGKFQLLRPSQKKVEFAVNGQKTSLPMKLGDGGEAFFVFETDQDAGIPRDYQTSPVISPVASPDPPSPFKNGDEPDFLDIGEGAEPSEMPSSPPPAPQGHSLAKRLSYEQAQKLSKKLTIKNIPTKIEANGDIFLDMQGYKSDNNKVHDSDEVIKNLLVDEFGDTIDLAKLIREDQEGNILINGLEDPTPSPPLSPAASDVSSFNIQSDDELEPDESGVIFAKSLRLTNEQLKCLNLRPGANDIQFSVNEGRASITARLFLWKYNVPIVISDIDGTITKSDALGHVLTMIGRDWTHEGVCKLFTDIALNGYNVMYLTARSVGQADATRNYLDSICQDGQVLPKGPVILSPDRTFAAFRREVILKKPEVFKMSCLNDIKSLYGLDNDSKTPFLAGFGNRITDALSYRSVGIPSSRIFTINPDGEVHMELLELAGYKSSYIFITELVDHFFPPVKLETVKTFHGQDRQRKKMFVSNEENYTDVNFWRDPIPELSDLSDEEVTPPPVAAAPASPREGAQTLSALPSSPTMKPFSKKKFSISENDLALETSTAALASSPDLQSFSAESSFDQTDGTDRDGDDTGDADARELDEDDDYHESEDEDYIDDDDEDEDDEEGDVIYEDEEDEDFTDYDNEDDDDDEEEVDYDEEEELDRDLLINRPPANSTVEHVTIGGNKEAPKADHFKIRKASDLIKESDLVADFNSLRLDR